MQTLQCGVIQYAATAGMLSGEYLNANGSTIHTGQLFFDDDYTDAFYAKTSPYSSRPTCSSTFPNS